MGRQSRLVVLLLLSLGVCQITLASTPHSLNLINDDIKDNELDSVESNDLLPEHPNSGIKISIPKDKATGTISLSKNVQQSPSTVAPAAAAAAPVVVPTTHKPVSDEIMNDLIEASKHSVALADDPQFNKMLPEKFKKDNKQDKTKTAHQSEENYDEDDYLNYEYDDDYSYDDSTSEPEPTKKSKTLSTKTTLKPMSKKEILMKPIKEDKKSTSTSKSKTDKDHLIDEADDMHDDYDEDDDDDDDDDDDENVDAEEEVVFNENVPCPRYCVCARNINSYLVATCSRFDPGTQKFGSDITDLIVTDVGPKYPILLGPKFFVQMGLKHVSSIKISNCTIEYLDPAAFHGLDELYSVNLTNVGLNIINPDTFAKNKKLRMLTISGNDLNVMSTVHYLLKSDSIEELDLSHNNLMDINPNAFTQLTNIVYINLSNNKLKKIPEKAFEKLETLEELDLSWNLLQSLPPTIFNRTSLSILHLQDNSLTGDLSFGTELLQQLDLSFNNINQIHHGMFDKMTGLTNLNLKGNGIIKIQPDSFLTLRSLRHIDLSVNDLDQISRMMFYKNSELDVIRLNDNPQLSQLPTDGFLSVNGIFTVYYLDISNCAINALGHKTFSTMPHLATLKLAWNNINYLERDTFASLKKLIDLDLSNNLIARLDELTFMYNNDLTKLNLAGNPLSHLSVRLFLPLNKLRELDVSECELTALLSDNYSGIGRKYKFFETLRSFNASANHIKNIAITDVKKFLNLRTLDISHNPIQCNIDFQDFISYVSLNTHMVTSKSPTLANIESSTTFNEYQPHAGWAELAREVCKHSDALKPKKDDKPTDETNTRIQMVEHELDEDFKHLLNIKKNDNHNINKILNDVHKTDVVVKDDHLNNSLDEEVDENDVNTAHEVKDEDVDENDSDYDEDEEEDADKQTYDGKELEDEFNRRQYLDAKRKMAEKMFNEPVEIVENGDSNEEEILINRRIFYTSSPIYITIFGIILCVLVLLAFIAKCILLIVSKRGERYRMAILASQKNSIVYQKLTEDLKPQEKESKQPKVHRYSPINQV